MPWFAPEFGPLLAVAAAELTDDGVVCEANDGFLKLIASKGRGAIGTSGARFFVQPDFQTLLRLQPGVGGEIYRGPVTLGDPCGAPWTLKARMWRADGRIRILAEYDIDDLARVKRALSDLNNVSAKLEFELAQANRKLARSEERSRVDALTDGLTNVANRRRLDQALEIEIERAARTGGKLCVAMADVDHFKAVNDTYGHSTGDTVLVACAQTLQQGVRKTDLVGRFGGEEFVVVMPDTPLAHALETADRLRKSIAAGRIDSPSVHVTASFGVAELVAGESADSLMRRVDKALYQAKESGRDRVVAALPPPLAA